MGGTDYVEVIVSLKVRLPLSNFNYIRDAQIFDVESDDPAIVRHVFRAVNVAVCDMVRQGVSSTLVPDLLVGPNDTDTPSFEGFVIEVSDTVVYNCPAADIDSYVSEMGLSNGSNLHRYTNEDQGSDRLVPSA